MMPNLANIRTWHDGLVSGRFPQGTGALVHKGRYCCLGVACRLAIEAGVPGIREVDTETDFGFLLTGPEHDYYETDTLPPEVRNWLGIESTDPELLTDDEGWVQATALNDSREMTFAEIAACIVRTWPDAFTSQDPETTDRSNP